MDEWLSLQEDPAHRFKKHDPWSNEAIDHKNVEELNMKLTIQKFLHELISRNQDNKFTGNKLTPGESIILQNLLKKYAQVKMKSSKYDAMNIQQN